MGEAKRRGSHEERVAEGIAKRAYAEAQRRAKLDKRWKEMSDVDRRKYLQMLSLQIIAGAGLS